MTIARFDDSLPRFARLVEDAWGVGVVQSNLFLRDATGRLTFVVLDEKFSSKDRLKLGLVIAPELNAYVDGPAFAVATPEELFDESLRDNPHFLNLELATESFTGSIKLIDRRMVGGDWLRSPVPEAAGPIRFVFASLKGGVGRSTALCVAAADFAKRGKRVLAIDMDLEAPGLGTFLLSSDTLPDFGLLDFLVESELGQTVDDAFLTDMVSASWLSGGLGRVDVIPAIGRRSNENPQNVLAKIARAYLTDTAGRSSATFQDRMEKLVNSFSDPYRYDLILIDARAGLHETTAAALLGLGANVLLFGVDQSQTYEGYKLLFSHLSTLPASSISDWKSRTTIVQAKASIESRQQNHFRESMKSVVDSWLNGASHQPETDEAASLRDTFEVHWDESEEDPLVLIDEGKDLPIVSVYDDDRYRRFDPASNRDILSSPFYSGAYSELLDLVQNSIDSEDLELK